MKAIVYGLLPFMMVLQTASAQYPGWRSTGSVYLLTTPEGAGLPASASEADFPLLVRLHKDWFPFSQAKPKGEDLRFSAGGKPLAYQIEEWDAAAGTASVWVRIPLIKGNARQEIKLHWGKADAASESNGKSVFNESNGYLSVWHMSDPVKDEVGTVESKDLGTAAAAGMIGPARHFPGGKGVSCGETIQNFPAGASPHSTEVWYRTDSANEDLVCWGKEGTPAGKVRMQVQSPPHIYIDSDGGSIHAKSALPKSEWVQVVHTYNGQTGQVYVNGQLDVAEPTRTTMKILVPARLWLGGWYNGYSFVGDMDEVRISKVARSADWIKLQYENQKPLQTLAGPLVQPGSAFAVSAAQLTVPEGKSVTLTAQAGGAQKVYWTLKSEGQETRVATDRFTFTFDAGRVSGDKALTLKFTAVTAAGVKTKEIPVTVKEDIPEPVFTLKAPAAWDGRTEIAVVPQVANLAALQAKGAGQLTTVWAVDGIAAIKENVPGKLLLKRAQNSGTLTVTATVSNGGKPSVQTVRIAVKEPAKDAWVVRTPAKDEKPSNNQFYARDDKNEGTLFYNGSLAEAVDSVFLKVYADGKLVKSESQRPKADKTYAFAVKIKAGLIKYKAEFGSKRGSVETVLNTADNLVCGDAYLIDGQSNAVSQDWGSEECTDTCEWVRSFGTMGGDAGKGWGIAVRRHGAWDIGCWPMDMAKSLVESQKVPICIMNGAAGGTLIEAHQRNPANSIDPATIYGRLLNRVQQAGLTHGIRGAFWHQGENNQGTQGATGGYGCETYEAYFIEMAAAWKQDYPNLQRHYIFQIWPNSCSMGGTKFSDRLRDVQRRMPRLYSNMSAISTLGIKPLGPCHFPPAGYAVLAKQVTPLVERDSYGKIFDKPVTAPDVKRAYFTSAKRDEIALEFDQPMAWSEALASEFYLDGEKGGIAAGSATGNVVKLKRASDAAVKSITYLADRQWSPDNLLCGKNGIAALTFAEVAIESGK